MSAPYSIVAEDGYVYLALEGARETWMKPDEAEELLHALESDPSAFLAELRAAVDEAHKQRRQR